MTHPTQGLVVVSHHSTQFPWGPHNKDGKRPATQNKAGMRDRTQTCGHTAVMSTCWGGQPFPLACDSADQGQAGDQIKVLVWGELGPGAREAAWGMDAHTSETQVKGIGWHCCRTGSKRGAAPDTGPGLQACRWLLENVKAGGSFNWNKIFCCHRLPGHVLYAN